MDNIMVLGAGIYQVPLIKAVKKNGYVAIVVSPAGHYPGLALADIWINADTRDKETVLVHARKYNICSILTTGTDVAVPTIGYINDHLNLPGVSYDVGRVCADKVLMKDFFRVNGIPSAQYEVVHNYDGLENAARNVGYPVMVKAVDCSGSRGIRLVSDERDLMKAYDGARSVSKSENVLLEEYLNGHEIGAQVVVVGSSVSQIFFHDDVVTPPPVSVPVGHTMPLTLEKDVSDAIQQVVNKLVSRLGIENSICNIDLLIVNQQPYVLEIGARMGATCLPENISVYTGMNIYDYLVQLSLGGLPELPDNGFCTASSSLLLRSHKTGVVKDIVVPDTVSGHIDLVELCLDIKPGDFVKKFQVGPDRIGHIVVSGTSGENASKTAEKLLNLIEITVD